MVEDCSMAKILVIDDEEYLRKVVRLILEEDGYEVLEAGNGRSGLELYRQYKADLIITDLAMPEMDGLVTRCSAVRLGKLTANILDSFSLRSILSVKPFRGLSVRGREQT